MQRPDGEFQQVEKDERDVLADRIQTWADTEDWHVYDYVDRLISDLDRAGFEIRRKPLEDPIEHAAQEGGATLLVGIHMPERNESEDPDDAADSLIGSINNTRKMLGGRRLTISLFPAPQWFTKRTMDVLRKAKDLVTEADEFGSSSSQGAGE